MHSWRLHRFTLVQICADELPWELRSGVAILRTSVNYWNRAKSANGFGLSEWLWVTDCVGFWLYTKIEKFQLHSNNIPSFIFIGRWQHSVFISNIARWCVSSPRATEETIIRTSMYNCLYLYITLNINIFRTPSLTELRLKLQLISETEYAHPRLKFVVWRQ